MPALLERGFPHSNAGTLGVCRTSDFGGIADNPEATTAPSIKRVLVPDRGGIALTHHSASDHGLSPPPCPALAASVVGSTIIQRRCVPVGEVATDPSGTRVWCPDGQSIVRLFSVASAGQLQWNAGSLVER